MTEDAQTDDVALSIGRCAEALNDLDRLRDELHTLRLSSDPRAQLAAALFDLERAKRGDDDARSAMIDIADALLVFWRDGTGERLAQEQPALAELWAGASALLVTFEVKRFKKALSTCWESRGDAALLQVAIEALQPEGNRRVEFARCLYHLELARLFVDTSRVEFAKRAGLLSEAYQSSQVADVLIGDDAGLKHLWEDLLPYLDEFFEMMEEEATARAKAKTDPGRPAVSPPSRGDVKTDPGVLAVDPSLNATIPGTALGDGPEVPSFRTLVGVTPSGGVASIGPQFAVGDVDAPPEPLPPEAWLAPGSIARDSQIIDGEVIEAELEVSTPAPPPPPRPTDLTPPPRRSLTPADTDIEVIDDVEVLPPPPPLPQQKRPYLNLDVIIDDGYRPDGVTLQFWQHTFQALDLLPDPKVQRVAKRLLSADSRSERKRLNEYLDTLWTHFAVPEARAFGCMLRLLMAGQLKEKSLFGTPNARRAEAFAQAFGLLSTEPLAAAHAAVFFQLDGSATEEGLQRGLDVLMEFLAFCAREKKDPLDAASHKDFLKL